MTFADGTKLTADAGSHRDRVGHGARPGNPTFLCSIPGHAGAGMTGAVLVGSAAPAVFHRPGRIRPADDDGPDTTARRRGPERAAYALRDATAPAVLRGHRP